MQISGNTSASALSMLQKLLQGASSSNTSATQELPGARQNTQGSATNTGCGGPQMGGGTMSALMSLQGGAPPSSSDLASQLVSGLDSDGDGEVSLDEIQQALSSAGQNADASQAFASVDKDGDGKLSTNELTSALDSLKQGHGHHRHHGGVEQAAQQITSSLDTDGDGQLSVDEITSALGSSESDSSNLSQKISSLDTNGDGKLSADELATAIRTQMENALKAYTSQATQSAAASVATI